MRDMAQVSRKNRAYQEKLNPCLREQGLSRKCLEDNDYEQEKCTLYFYNLMKCREFWDQVKHERRKQGIKPYLPYPDEREQIKAERLKKPENS